MAHLWTFICGKKVKLSVRSWKMEEGGMTYGQPSLVEGLLCFGEFNIAIFTESRKAIDAR